MKSTISGYFCTSTYEDGTFNVDDSVIGLSDYWNKPEHFSYLIFVDNEVVGFSLIRRYPDVLGVFDIGQFFVLRRFKRQGVGERAFELTVKKHPGKWLTRVLPGNVGAVKLWRQVIGKVSTEHVTTSQENYRENKMEVICYNVEAH